jgi:SAM-dependent methyltransferase
VGKPASCENMKGRMNLIAPQKLFASASNWLRSRGRYNQTPPVGKLRFGSLRRIEPISRDWGFDRGLPIDRYYIENFLVGHANDIRGRVLEIGDDSYTRKFGDDRVTASDVLHVVEGNPKATIVADLTQADHIPSKIFDCIIMTQTLQLIYDVREAIKTLHRILKSGGVLLATFPGISQTTDKEWGDYWCWNFTAKSARQLFGEFFSSENVKIDTFGNVLTAISFLHGIATEELRPEELDYRDPGYEVSITVRAVKD